MKKYYLRRDSKREYQAWVLVPAPASGNGGYCYDLVHGPGAWWGYPTEREATAAAIRRYYASRGLSHIGEALTESMDNHPRKREANT